MLLYIFQTLRIKILDTGLELNYCIHLYIFTVNQFVCNLFGIYFHRILYILYGVLRTIYILVYYILTQNL